MQIIPAHLLCNYYILIEFYLQKSVTVMTWYLYVSQAWLQWTKVASLVPIKV